MRIEKKGYLVQWSTITTGNTDSRHLIMLKPLNKGVIYSIETGVAGARIYINGTYVASTDKKGVAILPPYPEWFYELAITARGYKSYKETIEITQLNLRKALTITLEKQ